MFRYINCNKTKSEHIAHIQNYDGRIITDDTEKATVLNAFFYFFTQEKEGYTDYDSIFNSGGIFIVSAIAAATGPCKSGGPT